jgi:sugar phosphate isomerase/epimerase
VRDHLQKRGPADIELRPGKSGQFDVTVDGTLKYTRSKTGRFPTDEDGLRRGRVCGIGEGEVDWPEIFDLCETIGSTEWYIVEQESYAFPPLECVDRCLQNLRKMGK